MYKHVNALVREVNTRIQDSLYKFFYYSADEKLVYTEIYVAREDFASREFLNFEWKTLDTSGDPMLRVTLKLDPIVTVHQRRKFGILMLFRDIGGICFFIFLIMTAIMKVLVGNKY